MGLEIREHPAVSSHDLLGWGNELLTEVELNTKSIVAATVTRTPLTGDEIDRLLGLEAVILRPSPALEDQA